MNPDDEIGVHLIPRPLLCVQVKQLMVPQGPSGSPRSLALGLVAPFQLQDVGNDLVFAHFTCKIPRRIGGDRRMAQIRAIPQCPHNPGAGAATSAKILGPTSRHFCSKGRKRNEMLRESGRVCDVWLCCPGCDGLWPVGTRQGMDRVSRGEPVHAPAPMAATNCIRATAKPASETTPDICKQTVEAGFFSYYEQSSVLKESELEAGHSGALGTAGDNCQAPHTAMGCLQVM